VKWTKEYRREVREQRKREGRCIDCAALMLPEWPALVYCPMCKETRDINAKRYRTSRKGLAATRKRNRVRRADPVRRAKEWKRSAERLFQRKIDGICRQCKEPSLEDSLYCAVHRESVNKASREHQRRKAARARGIIIPAPKRTRKKIARFRRPRVSKEVVAIVSSTPIADYRRGDMEFAGAVLRFIDLCNGVTALEIADEFNVNEMERNNMDVALSRFVRAGKVRAEKDGDGHRIYYPLRQQRRAA
jgi:hypothetical protein